MRTRLRLAAAVSVALGALLLATALASPALAWHSNVTVSARCLDNGKVRIHYTVEAWEDGHNATVDVAYNLNGEVTKLESDEHFFAPGHDQFSGQFNLPAGTTGEITIIAVAHWENGDTSHNKGSAELPDECGGGSGSTTTTAPTTTAPSTTLAPTTTAPSSTVAPSSTQQPTTTVAVGAATSTTGGGQLPFTGAGSSQPMLLVGIALVGGGALFLLLSRERRATR